MDMSPQTIQPAIDAPEIDSVAQGTQMVINQHKRVFYSAWAVAVVLVFVGFMWLVNSGGEYAPNAWFFLLVPLAVPLFFYFRYAKQARQMMMTQIAQSFGYSYSADASLDSIDGLIFSNGHSRSMSDVLSGTYRDHPVRMFTYQFTVGSGKSAHTYTDTVCELTYDAPLPHVVLLPHQWLGVSADVGLFSGLGNLQKGELEGDFNEHFDIYVEKDAQLELREIFEPDIMQELVNLFKDCDVEISGNKLYILVHSQYSTRAQYVVLHGLAGTLIDKLLPGLRSASQDVVPTKV